MHWYSHIGATYTWAKTRKIIVFTFSNDWGIKLLIKWLFNKTKNSFSQWLWNYYKGILYIYIIIINKLWKQPFAQGLGDGKGWP